ncbi:MAG TPA: hypothetical protein VH593_07650 [Ktedonobacteraceae bacterium]|jgi:hypothetical protein
MPEEEKMVPAKQTVVATKRLGSTAWIELYDDGWLTIYDQDPGGGQLYEVSLSDEGARGLKNFFRRQVVHDVLYRSR